VTGENDARPCRIVAYSEIASPAVDRGIEHVFFAASGTQVFASAETRAVFRQRWLGRYLADEPEHAFVACGPGDSVIGYLVGALDDPGASGRYRDIGYFDLLAAETAAYPAHLHVNIDDAWRGAGIGACLVDAFCEHAATARTPGVHVVTGAAARNVGFYRARGFETVRGFDWQSRPLLMLGRRLSSPAG
jgi:GNAT superfamily N-acetyltransferase